MSCYLREYCKQVVANICHDFSNPLRQENENVFGVMKLVKQFRCPGITAQSLSLTILFQVFKCKLVSFFVAAEHVVQEGGLYWIRGAAKSLCHNGFVVLFIIFMSWLCHEPGVKHKMQAFLLVQWTFPLRCSSLPSFVRAVLIQKTCAQIILLWMEFLPLVPFHMEWEFRREKTVILW
jgi:hypothetical protein